MGWPEYDVLLSCLDPRAIELEVEANFARSAAALGARACPEGHGQRERLPFLGREVEKRYVLLEPRHEPLDSAFLERVDLASIELALVSHEGELHGHRGLLGGLRDGPDQREEHERKHSITSHVIPLGEPRTAARR